MIINVHHVRLERLLRELIARSPQALLQLKLQVNSNYKFDDLYKLLVGAIAGAVVGTVTLTSFALGISIKWYLKRRLMDRRVAKH